MRDLSTNLNLVHKLLSEKRQVMNGRSVHILPRDERLRHKNCLKVCFERSEERMSDDKLTPLAGKFLPPAGQNHDARVMISSSIFIIFETVKLFQI